MKMFVFAINHINMSDSKYTDQHKFLYMAWTSLVSMDAHWERNLHLRVDTGLNTSLSHLHSGIILRL